MHSVVWARLRANCYSLCSTVRSHQSILSRQNVVRRGDWAGVFSALAGFLMVSACGHAVDTDVTVPPYSGTGGQATTPGSAGGGGDDGVGGDANTAAGDTGRDGGAGGSAGTSSDRSLPQMFGAPLLFSPTPSGFGLSVVLTRGDPAELAVRVRADHDSAWGELQSAEVRADDAAEWQISGLEPGSHYRYQVLSGARGGAEVLYEGGVSTAQLRGAPFEFALISDTHIGAHLDYPNQGDAATLSAVSDEIRAVAPDFVINLGDLLDYHEFGFNVPPPDTATARLAFLNYRASLGGTLANACHFTVIGNWDGETGAFSPDVIARSREPRLLYLPGPSANTYPEGGSPNQDYYAFNWGDALFVVLNVMSYTPTPHLLSGSPELADDWTLGQTQLDWLERTLKNASAKWRFLFIHHTVGGKAGDDANSTYGRGGGQAAYVGEQAIVHRLMLDNGAQVFFYGHDHVFVDLEVDGIHYSEPGSAGAPWKFSTLETGYLQYWPESGWARVEVTPEQVRVQFLSLGAGLLHEYVID